MTATNDPARALALCEQLDPDLLLLDLQMPGIDGFELLARLAETHYPEAGRGRPAW